MNVQCLLWPICKSSAGLQVSGVRPPARHSHTTGLVQKHTLVMAASASALCKHQTECCHSKLRTCLSWKVMLTQTHAPARTGCTCHGRAALGAFLMTACVRAIRVLCRLCLVAQGRRVLWGIYGCLTSPAGNGLSQRRRGTPQQPGRCTLAPWWMTHEC